MYKSLENKENLSRELWIEIDLDALASNMREVKYMAGKARVCAVIKADGYGHGAARVAPTLLENGADMFAVATVDEAFEIRELYPEVPILVLGGVNPMLAPELAAENIAVAVDSPEKLKAFSDALYSNKRMIKRYDEGDFPSDDADDEDDIDRVIDDFRLKDHYMSVEQSDVDIPKLKVHIKVDTGMGRIGVLPGVRMADAFAKLAVLDNIEIEGVFSHFARADEDMLEGKIYRTLDDSKMLDDSLVENMPSDSFSYTQATRFDNFLSLLKERGVVPDIKHMSNSAATLALPEFRYDMVRVGALLFGISPGVKPLGGNFKPVLSIKSRAIFVKKLSYPTGISYGHTYEANKGDVIVTVPAGYADGISRHLSGKMDVLIGGKRCRQIGNICMDYFMVAGYEGIKVGDEITILGAERVREDVKLKDGSKNKLSDGYWNPVKETDNSRESEIERITVEEMAEKMGSISYEVVCMLSKRIPRIYIE